MSTQEVVSSQAELDKRIAGLRRLTQRLAVRNSIALALLWVITVLVAALFIYIVIRLLVLGAPTLLSATFYGTSEAGIAPQLFNTFYILILTELFLFPIGLAPAIYLVEFSPQVFFISIIHFAAETLALVSS